MQKKVVLTNDILYNLGNKKVKKLKTVIFGAGSWASYVSYVLSHDSAYEVCAFCVEKDNKNQEIQNHEGLPIIDFDDLNKIFPPDEYQLFISVGNNWVRERVYKIAKSNGYSFISYVSSKAIVYKDLEYGENVFISEGSVIQPFVSIGDNTTLIDAKIGHHSQIGNNALLSSCSLGGNVKIGDNSFLGMNSTIKQNVSVGRNNIIGMGSNITKNTDDDEVYAEKATIKRTISSEKIRDKYLGS